MKLTPARTAIFALCAFCIVSGISSTPWAGLPPDSVRHNVDRAIACIALVGIIDALSRRKEQS